MKKSDISEFCCPFIIWLEWGAASLLSRMQTRIFPQVLALKSCTKVSSVIVYCLRPDRCVPSMAQTSLSINAGTAAQWLFSSALAPHTSATPATMISSEWQAYPKRSCPIVLQVLSSSVYCTWPKRVRTKITGLCLCLLQGPKENSWREQSALYMWFIHQQGRNLPWGVGFVEMPTPSKEVFTENQFVYCDFCLWLKLSREAQLLHGRVSWTLDQVSALRQEFPGLLLLTSVPRSLLRTCCGSCGFRVIRNMNNRI